MKRKWMEKLTAEQRQHVRESCMRPTLRCVRLNVEAQRRMGLVCWQCEDIARRLGLGV